MQIYRAQNRRTSFNWARTLLTGVEQY